MLKLKNGEIEFRIEDCMQCGACLAACPGNSLASSALPDGLNEIVCDHASCTACGLCTRVCPVDRVSTSEFRYEEYLDRSRPILAWARDPEIRRAASSGGVARTILVEGLRSGFFDGAYALAKTDVYPFAEGRVMESAEYTDLPNSVYHPVAAMANLRLDRKYRNFLVVGTSCQLTAAQRLLRGKVENLFQVAIFCKQQKKLDSARAIARRVGISGLNASNFVESRYRGPDWPGTVRINSRDLPWEQAAAVPFGRRLFQVPGCRLCSDPFGNGADLSLMDPWGIEAPGTPGKNLVYVASENGERILRELSAWIETQTVDPAKARASVTPSDLEYKRFFRERRRRGVVSGLPERLERAQTSVLEFLLLRLRLPRSVHKILAHLPDVKRLNLAFDRNRKSP